MEKSLLLHLPYEQLIPIFSFCYVKDLLNLALTSKSFYSILKEYLWEVIEIPWKALAHESVRTKNLEWLKFTCELHISETATPLNGRLLQANYFYLLSHCNVNKLTVLRVDGNLNDVSLLTTCKLLPNLVSLSIKDCAEIFSDSWSCLNKLDNLESLSVDYCKIDDVAVDNISQIPNLKELRFGRMCNLTICGLEKLCSFTKLKTMMICDADITVKPRYFSNNSLLKELTLEYVQVQDEIIEELGSLNDLKSLSIVGGSGITDNGFSLVKYLVSLKKLDLVYNNFLDSTFSNLTHLTMLSELDLSASNNLTKIGMNSICMINTLTKLSLHGCMDLEDSALESIGDLQNLVSLDISNCKQITDQGIYHISKLKKLRTLNLVDVYLITDESIRFISNLLLMKDLNLQRCQKITDGACQYLSSLKELKKLNLSFGPNISNLGLTYLGNIASMTSLNIEKCERVDNDGLSHLTKLTSLQELNIGGCTRISDDGFYFISQIKLLSKLKVSFCPVTDIGLTFIAKSLFSLHLIDISNCSYVSNDGVNALGKLPLLKQVWLKDCANVHLLTLSSYPNINFHKNTKHWTESKMNFLLDFLLVFDMYDMVS